MVYKENRVVREKPIHPVRSRKDAPLGRVFKIAVSGGTILATNILLYSTPRYETIPPPQGFGERGIHGTQGVSPINCGNQPS